MGSVSLPFEPNLRIFRDARYRGDSQSVPLARLPQADQERVQALYRFLLRMQEYVEKTQALPEWLVEEVDQCEEHLRGLGTCLPVMAEDDLTARALHDTRGGCMGILLLLLAEKAMPETISTRWRPIHFCCRDQAKILRNSFQGLDPNRQQQDLLFKPHYLETVLTKLEAVPRFGGPVPVRVEITQRFSGALTSCCQESAAVDRVLHNLLNNASQHVADGVIQVQFQGVRAEAPRDVRVIMSNRITSEHREQVQPQVDGHGVMRARTERVSHGLGAGHGLAIAADFIRDAYGLESGEQAWREGYLGAWLHGDWFSSWFHWPLLLTE